MKADRLSEREQALIAAARRDAVPKAKPSAAVGAPDGAPRARPGREREIGAAGPPPFDGPTVVGWDASAAQAAPGPAAEKWARVAALMEDERREAEERRRKAQRRMVIFLSVVLGVVLIATVRVLVR